jgi:hypothetical protein
LYFVVHYGILVILDRALHIQFLTILTNQNEREKLTMLDKFFDVMLVVLLLAFIANLIKGAI